RPRPLISVPPAPAYGVGVMLGSLLGDVVITRDEIRGLMDGLLFVDAPPAGETRLTQWAAAHADQLGRRYASELARRHT
ncbi:MAG: epimerase, partial [Gemmatimonadetes bacterium]|nr:epimerase [Gemmatimonadota bacterium]